MILKSSNFVTFPTYLSIIFGAQNGKKRGFQSIFVVGGTNFRIIKLGFLAFFEAKMTKIVILDQKLIVPNDYLQFWAHFEWFLSLFQISEVKQLLSQFKLKVRKNGTFRSQNPFLKNFPMLFWSPKSSYAKKSGQIGP